MKRFIKILVNALAVVMLGVCALSFTACQDMKTIEVNTKVYSTTDSSFKERTLTIDLYRHLAPKTVDAVLSAIEKGYYDNAFFYIDNSIEEPQIMIGQYKYVDGQIVQNDVEMPTIKGEFENNGVIGSNLKSNRGSVGLWRSWYANGSYSVSNEARNSGSANWYIPTAGLNSYTGNFAVFGTYDLENEDNADIIADISSLTNVSLTVQNYENYVVFFTGEYQETGKNNGLTFHCVLASEFSASDYEDIFVAEGNQLVCYNMHTITVPFANRDNATLKTIGATITSINVK